MRRIKDIFTTYRNNRYLEIISYALLNLKDTKSTYTHCVDREYRKEIVTWLHDYYSGKLEESISPEQLLSRILRKSTYSVQPRDHIYVAVLYSWLSKKRIDCY